MVDCLLCSDSVSWSSGDTRVVRFSDVVWTQFVAKATEVGVDDINRFATATVDGQLSVLARVS